MNTRSVSMLMLSAAVLLTASLATVDSAEAIERRAHRRAASMHTWHGSHYHSAWGTPVALVVPPTAEYQTHWGWGVGNTRVTPICPQFHRNYPGPMPYHAGSFQPTPRWPSDTDQFGVYYVRGPW
jgi:hypothetical protein